MKKYSDIENAKGVYIIFAVVQMILLALMYTIVYAAFRATQLAVEKFELNEVTAFAPTIIVLSLRLFYSTEPERYFVKDV